MALFDTTIMATLEADAPTAAIIGSRVYTTVLPEKTAFPAISIALTGTIPENQLDGTFPTEQQRFDLNLFADTKTEMVALISAVETAMRPLGFKVGMEDLTELEKGFFRYVLEYSIFN